MRPPRTELPTGSSSTWVAQAKTRSTQSADMNEQQKERFLWSVLGAEEEDTMDRILSL